MKQADIKKGDIVHMSSAVNCYTTNEAEIHRAIMVVDENCVWKEGGIGKAPYTDPKSPKRKGVLVKYVKLEDGEWVTMGDTFVEYPRNILSREDFLAKCQKLAKDAEDRKEDRKLRQAAEKLSEKLGYPVRIDGDWAVSFKREGGRCFYDMLIEIHDMRRKLGKPIKRVQNESPKN